MANESTSMKAPAHVAIIMDGNGRWAKERGLPRMAGHRAGTKTCAVLCAQPPAPASKSNFYAFSAENWKRPEEEVNEADDFATEFIETEIQELHKEGARLLHIGHLDGLGPALKRRSKTRSS